MRTLYIVSFLCNLSAACPL